MKHYQLTFFLLLVIVNQDLSAQTSFCEDDPPLNPYLADSPWPTYHRNGFRQASTCIAGPSQGDSLRVVARHDIKGGTSPWTYISDEYANGERVLLQSNSTHAFKFVDEGEQIVAVDSFRVDFDPITSFGWNFLLTNDKVWFTYDPKYDPENGESTKMIKLSDEDPEDPYSKIIALDTFDFGDHGINRVQTYALNYDGDIVFTSENNIDSGYAVIGILSQEFELLDTLHFHSEEGEIFHHNSIAIDENNAFYFVTTNRMVQFLWDGNQLTTGFNAAYDFIFDGPTGAFAEGSGTTPTLMGWGEGKDKLVVLTDGHSNNNLLAFWREIPEDWTGIPGMDIHFADSIQLPAAETFSNLFQSIENSPVVSGYGVAVAQYNGFLGQDCPTVKGVQKLSWDTTNNQFVVDWVNSGINLNSVLLYSRGSDLLYGSGKEDDCNYYYYGLNWETGAIDLRLYMGPEQEFLTNTFDDGGSGNIIDENGNIYFAGGASLVKIEILNNTPTSNSSLPSFIENRVSVFPNPSSSDFSFRYDGSSPNLLKVMDINGKEIISTPDVNSNLSLSGFPSGLYTVIFVFESNIQTKKIMLSKP